jgi:hypothetical protein
VQEKQIYSSLQSKIEKLIMFSMCHFQKESTVAACPLFPDQCSVICPEGQKTAENPYFLLNFRNAFCDHGNRYHFTVFCMRRLKCLCISQACQLGKGSRSVLKKELNINSICFRKDDEEQVERRIHET